MIPLTTDTFDPWEALCVQGAIFFIVSVILMVAAYPTGAGSRPSQPLRLASLICFIISIASFLGGLWLSLGTVTTH